MDERHLIIARPLNIHYVQIVDAVDLLVDDGVHIDQAEARGFRGALVALPIWRLLPLG